MSAPFQYTSGRKDARIAVVGEAWGEQEEKIGQPFIGQSGQELTRMLDEAGIKRSECFLTNTFALRPPSNNIELLCGKKADVGKEYPYTSLKQGKYILNEFLPELERLRVELETVRPNIIIALGNTACWAILQSAKIGTLRGVINDSLLTPGIKVLPTYHPSAVLRNWALRPIVLADLMKAQREASFPEIVRPKRRILIWPTLAEIQEWVAKSADIYGVDIETGAKQIKCIGFANSASEAIVIPFFDPRQSSGNYWPDLSSELAAWELVQQMLESPVPKVFQNGMYDLQYIWKMGIATKNCLHDTMLKHHAMYPEMQKGLGFLGSVYTNEATWKLMRTQKADVEKKDE